MNIRILLAAAVFMAFPLFSRAQFYSVGDNPASVKWSRADYGQYKVIYPQGLDSLANVYGKSLEKYKYSVGRSVGYVPGEYTWGRIPVILHPYDAQSNGVVSWAPRQMNLFTSPQPYGGEPMPWVDMLAIHEQRHVAQMQAGLSGAFRPFGWIFGEMFNGFVAGIYPSNALLEGDAVIAETALSHSGRGRTADFLNYYMIAFDNGDYRSWNRWRFGSQKYNTPDHYAAGYFLLSGIRYLYDVPDFTGRYFHHIARRPYDLNAFRNTIKKTTGKKPKEVYREIVDTMSAIWTSEIQSRAPFTPYRQIVRTPSRYTEYLHTDIIGDYLYSIKTGLAQPDALVRISRNGKEEVIRSFSSEVGKFSYFPHRNRFYWSETVPDKRWEMKKNSIIRYYDITKKKTVSITKKGRLFSPYAAPDEQHLCVSEYYDDGRTGVTVLDMDSGERIVSVFAPDSVQIVESVWTEDKIYATGISGNGYGLYSIGIRDEGSDSLDHEIRFFGEWETVLPPQPVKIQNITGDEEKMVFVCDRTGVYELYYFYPDSGRLVQKTSTPYGADEFAFSPDGQLVYFSAKQYDGNLIGVTSSANLLDKDVEYSDIHVYPVAEKLSEQERMLASGEYEPDSLTRKNKEIRTYSSSTPQRYRKFGNLFKLHSWAPVYFNVDRLMDFSFDHSYEALSLGFAGLSQNELGNAVTQFGYSAHKDPYNKDKWRHSGHLSFTYTGWYPVIEASVDFNDRASRSTVFSRISTGDLSFVTRHTQVSNNPYVTGNISVYIPFNFSRGGWAIGLVPKVSYSISNDYVRTDFGISYPWQDMGNARMLSGSSGRNIPVQTTSSSVRVYAMRPVASSGIYPRWGIGFEGGAMSMPALGRYFSPMTFGYLYGYLPGIIPQHGLHFSVLGQKVLNGLSMFGTPAVNTIPQGLSANSTLVTIASNYSSQSLKMSVDYALPIYIGDISIFGPFMYLKRLILNPHFDYSMFDWMRGTGFSGSLYSVGATLTIDFERLFWLRFPFSVGVTYSYSGGSAFDTLAPTLESNGAPMGHHYIGPVFSVDF